MNIIGLDIGTTTISGVLVNSSDMQVLHTISLPNASHISTANAWEDCQDPKKIWAICQDLLARLYKIQTRIDGIGICGQMHGILYVDAAGKACSHLATWQDARGDLPYQVSKTYAEYLRVLTGYQMSTGFGLTTHFYNQINGCVPEKAVKMCSILNFIAMQLCGSNKPLAHASDAAGFGMFDLQCMQFDPQALMKAGISAEFLPEVVKGEKIIGYTADGAAVCVPIGDNQAGFLGTLSKGCNVLINIGTSSQISVKSKKPIRVEGLDLRPYVNGEYLLVGAGLCGGSAYALLRDLFKDMLHEYGIKDSEDLYGKMEAAGLAAYGKENQLEIDARFRGTRTEPGIRGKIEKIGVDNFTLGHLAVGILQGVCDELKGFYDVLPAELRQSGQIAGSGNAIRKNRLLRKIVADTFGKELVIPQFEEEAAIGAAKFCLTVL